MEERQTIPSYFANQPATYNHSELWYINNLACEAGYAMVPFPEARPLPEDNGERFFGEYWLEEIQRRRKFNSSPLNDRCQCDKCGGGSAPLPHVQEYPVIEEINVKPAIPEKN